jgi:RNA polymerase sigma-70 factor (ECF subfamily)
MASHANNAAPSEHSGRISHSGGPGGEASWQGDRLPRVTAGDRTLLAQIAAGQEEALRQLYASYRPRLWRFVYQQVHGDGELTNTVLQDVFLAVWRAAGSYRGEATVATWLFRIARNIAGNARRSAMGDKGLSYSAPEQAGEHESDAALAHTSPEQEIVDRLALLDAFEQLSPKYREVLELVFSQGFTYDETAQVLDIPLGTVKSRLNGARQALSRALAEHDDART